MECKDIAKLHFDISDKPYQANRTLGVLSTMFLLAEIWGPRPDGSNPCRHVKRCKERKHEQFLSLEETERLGEILRERSGFLFDLLDVHLPQNRARQFRWRGVRYAHTLFEFCLVG